LDRKSETVRARIPVSTYRLQFNHQFTFEQAAALVEYFRELGVTDIYASPVLKARAGSLHGYDVVDHTKINPEVGTEEDFARLGRLLREREMGVLMDVVPNHMCIAGSENRWWLDVLENGPGSPFARFFDVDWNPPNPNLKNRILIPILGDQFGRVLEGQEIKITYRDGAFHANYYKTTLPVASRTSTLVLGLALRDLKARLDPEHGDVLELESIITSLGHLPPRTETDPARVRERRREKEVVKRRLSTLVKESHDVRASVHAALAELNGTPGRPPSFDLLEELLSEQAYRLSFWRVASDEINYRRFFDVNELAAVRVEERPVFAAVHEVVFRLMRQGLVTGLRIDHVDGLLDPLKYLRDLQREAASAWARPRGGVRPEDGETPGGGVEKELPCYVVVEKILEHDEQLRREWPIHGTTGYEFLNTLNGVFVEHANAQALRELYRDFTGFTTRFSDLLYECKKLILHAAMSSELHVLARRLARISEQHRFSRDFTLNSLQYALGEVIACFPVYRSYIRRTHESVSPDDRLHINAAVRDAKRRNAAQDPSIFDFIGSLLLLEDPKGTGRAERAARRDFVLRFQQLTSPVTAKGLEDTAFYRFYPLASLNEVGGAPAIIGIPLERFHERNQERQQSWPHALSATATHDTKRGEDTRARINVLSEMPEEWNQAIHLWRDLNRRHRARFEGAEAPDANEEYLLYQTLVGTWPLAPMGAEEHALYVSRIQEYMRKALKEAKLHTSWINPDEAYERAVVEFAAAVLDAGDGNQFLREFAGFQQLTARCGMLNSLSQTLLKIAAPGVPDFYQGTELWSLTLVDPDNRRPVDYEHRRALLAGLNEAGDGDRAALVGELLERPEDGRVKLYVTTRALGFRKARRELFGRGDYVPLEAAGRRAGGVVAFARKAGDDEVVVVAGRFFTRLGVGRTGPLGLSAEAWGDTTLALGDQLAGARWRELFTGAEFDTREGGKTLRLSDVLSPLPVALLERVAE
jgi:(1->4)-alpha-D-glucan 1-alpha-D-glucosylmutase